MGRARIILVLKEKESVGPNNLDGKSKEVKGLLKSSLRGEKGGMEERFTKNRTRSAWKYDPSQSETGDGREGDPSIVTSYVRKRGDREFRT